MLKKISVSILCLLAILLSPLSAQNKSEKVKPVKKSILIVKDSSDLEVAVCRIVTDSLSKLGYTVKEVGLADIGNEKASSYKFSIVFSAITAAGEVDPSIQKFIDSGVGKSKVHLYTVYGKVFNKHLRSSPSIGKRDES